MTINSSNFLITCILSLKKFFYEYLNMLILMAVENDWYISIGVESSQSAIWTFPPQSLDYVYNPTETWVF